MYLIIQMITLFLLLFWPIIMMMSPMAFDAPGSENNREHIIGMMVFLCYPILLCALYWIFDARLFGISGRALTLAAAVMVVLALGVSGYGSLLKNALSGIASSGYSKVNNRVYYNASPVAAADSATFEVLGNRYDSNGYARDNKQVYFRGERLADADAASFHPMDSDQEYWADNQQVYLNGKAVPGADPTQFKRVEDAWGNPSGYALSGTTLYYGTERIGEVTPDEVSIITPAIAKDRERIYYLGKMILPMADAPSFVLLPDTDGYARDHSAVYDLIGDRSAPIAGADPQTMNVLNRGYLKDANRIYHREGYEPTEILHDVDYDSFVVTDWDDETQSEARDRYALYMNGRVVKQLAEKAAP
ncbi:MAG: DKNYY domain-containing protein [Saccharospirillaceae bacterium]|nr:DKNYY domain-containing protein [Saccharospirillaceae bacterium]MCD8533180.1 DKNYY domain-containing protein [Saccharospirillaceae bacterium]